MGDPDQTGKGKDEPKEPRSEEATTLRLLRESRGLTQTELDRRAQLPEGRVGKYERDDSKLTLEDQRKVLEGLDYPERAWTETAAHARRLRWLRSRYAATRTAVVDRDPDADLAGLVVETDGRPDVSAVRRELRRIAETRGRHEEELFGDLLGLVGALLLRDPGSES